LQGVGGALLTPGSLAILQTSFADEDRGRVIGAWSGLPLEGVFVWAAVTYATVIVFEVIKVLVVSDRTPRETLLGKAEGL